MIELAGQGFLVRAAVAGMGVAIVAAPLGVFVVWRRMAYFGDALSHSALLGVALGLLAGLDVNIAIVIVCGALALLFVVLQRQQALASDTVLGILAHSALSIGICAVAFIEGVRVDLLSYLFGDILSVGRQDLAVIYAGGALVFGLLAAIWRPLLSMTVHEELARVEGAPVMAVRVVYMLLLAVVIATAMKVVGILLVTSMLIIPAAAARRFARTPEAMAAIAAAIGSLSVFAGLWGSYQWDTPSGPSIVVAAAAIFALSGLFGLVRRT